MTTHPETIDQFLATYAKDREVQTIDLTDYQPGHTPFIRVQYGSYEAIVTLQGLKDHLDIDVHPFVDGDDATAGVFGMTEGNRFELPDTGATSHGWPSVKLVAVLVGEQA